MIDDPDRGHLAAVLGIVDVRGDSAPRVQGRARRLPRRRRADGKIAARGSRLPRARHRRRSPTGVTTTRRSRPRPICKSSPRSCRPSGPQSASPSTPMPTAWRSSTRTGRYIGEELTLALAATRRLGQDKGPVILNLSTSRVTETLARAAGCVVFRTPVGEINVVQRMVDVNAVLGGEGNGGVIDPRVGYVRDSFVGMAMVLDLMAATGEPLSSLVAGLAAVCDGQGAVSAGRRRDRQRRLHSAARLRSPTLWDRIADAWPDARADRRDGLRLDWDDRWVHVRASNTEPIVRVIAEAAEPRSGARAGRPRSGDSSAPARRGRP